MLTAEILYVFRCDRPINCPNMNPIVVAAIISAASSVASVVGNSAMSRRNARDAEDFSAEQAELAYNRQLDFWTLQNEFNDPSAQRERLSRAGLSAGHLAGGTPNLTAGGLSSVQSPQGVKADTPKFDFVTSLLQTAQSFKELQEVGLISEETKAMFEEVVSKKLTNELKRQMQADGWSKLQIQEMERVAQFRALYGDDAEFPENPFFDNSDLRQPIVNNPELARYNEIIANTSLADAYRTLYSAQAKTEDELRDARLVVLTKDAEVSDALKNLYNVTSIATKHETKREDAFLPYRMNATAALQRLNLDESDLIELESELKDIEVRFKKGDLTDDETNVLIDKWFERAGKLVGVSLAFIPNLGRKLQPKPVKGYGAR